MSTDGPNRIFLLAVLMNIVKIQVDRNNLAIKPLFVAVLIEIWAINKSVC